jgi:hypothetical protein
MTSHATQREIRERLVALIATHAGVAPETIGRGGSIWLYFPARSGIANHPSVTSFVADVHSQLDVYLTEDEWEEPSVDILARRIYMKRQNPGESLADRNREWAALRKGMAMSFIFGNAILGPIGWLSAAGPWRRRALVVLVLLIVLNCLILAVYLIEARRLRPKPTPGSATSRE